MHYCQRYNVLGKEVSGESDNALLRSRARCGIVGEWDPFLSFRREMK
jgi:hypothetical protein